MAYPPEHGPEHVTGGPTDPATTRLPHARYDDPRHNPIKFLPADEPAGGWEPGARTAGEQDHTDPWIYAAEVAPPPEAP